MVVLTRVFLGQGHSLTRMEEHTPKLWLVHKLRSELVTRQDPEGRPTIFDRLARIKLPDTLMPVVGARASAARKWCFVSFLFLVV